MSEKPFQRNPAMDIIRCFALFFTISVHFFLHSGYYSQPVNGTSMYFMTLLRSFFMICVPLFIILSGYLLYNKTVNSKHYQKLIYTVAIYFFASICCFLYKCFFSKANETFSITKFIKGFFNYSDAPYSWYVEMYLGLFLLCPFLNILYKNLNSKKEKQILLTTLIILTSIPSITNIFIPNIRWFANPASSSEYVKILPTYWLALYPITYYFLGCYLKEYKLKYSQKKIILLSSALFLFNGTFNYYRSHNSTFKWGMWQDYGSILIVVQATLFFTFFANIDYSKFPYWTSKVLKKISELCFGAYLVSWIFDNHFYEILNNSVPDISSRFKYYIIIVPVVYISSLILSFIINIFYKVISLCLNKIFKLQL